MAELAGSQGAQTQSSISPGAILDGGMSGRHGASPSSTLRKPRERLQVSLSEESSSGFPGGPVVKNLPYNTRATGSIRGLGRSHMPWNNEASVPQLPSLCARAQEPQGSSPRATPTEAHAPQSPRSATREKPPQGEACVPQ